MHREPLQLVQHRRPHVVLHPHGHPIPSHQRVTFQPRRSFNFITSTHGPRTPTPPPSRPAVSTRSAALTTPTIRTKNTTLPSSPSPDWPHNTPPHTAPHKTNYAQYTHAPAPAVTHHSLASTLRLPQPCDSGPVCPTSGCSASRETYQPSAFPPAQKELRPVHQRRTGPQSEQPRKLFRALILLAI
jgi:hypothetical protein